MLPVQPHVHACSHCCAPAESCIHCCALADTGQSSFLRTPTVKAAAAAGSPSPPEPPAASHLASQILVTVQQQQQQHTRKFELSRLAQKLGPCLLHGTGLAQLWSLSCMCAGDSRWSDAGFPWLLWRRSREECTCTIKMTRAADLGMASFLRPCAAGDSCLGVVRCPACCLVCSVPACVLQLCAAVHSPVLRVPTTASVSVILGHQDCCLVHSCERKHGCMTNDNWGVGTNDHGVRGVGSAGFGTRVLQCTHGWLATVGAHGCVGPGSLIWLIWWRKLMSGAALRTFFSQVPCKQRERFAMSWHPLSTNIHLGVLALTF